MVRFLLYVLRWQLSTPILWPVVHYLGTGITSIIIANLIGSIIFFWADRFIFSPTIQEWEVMQQGECADCGKHTAVRCLRYDPRGYDKRSEPNPEFRCQECSRHKFRRLGLS